MKEQDEKKVDSAQNATPSIPYKERSVISENAKQERLLLSGMLIQQADDRTDEALLRKKKREEEIIELHGGQKISVSEINASLTTLQPYAPMFPNSVPFFSEIYRLNSWKDRDPNLFIKPMVVGSWINEIIYSRFSKEVLPALRILNPASPFGIRAHKHFQYLSAESQAKLVQFRDEAIAIMQTCTTWYEFRKKLLVLHGVPYQMRLFEK